MNRLLPQLSLAALSVLLVASSSRGQAPPAQPPTQPPTQPTGGGNRGNSTGQQSEQPQNQNRDQQMPLYVEGQILTETGKPPDPVSVKLSCGMRTLQVIRSDVKGYFRFALGVGTQANMDFSAADESPSSSIMSGMNVPGGYSGFGTGGNSLTGCDVRISVPGFQPLMTPITDPAALGTIEIGVLELRRTTSAPSGAVSATSLLVPNNARKEYDQGVKALQSNQLPQATQHLERAVGAYDKYAAAWTELGKVYAANHEMAKARQSFEKAIEADSKYVPPYVSLAAVKLEDLDYEGALETLGKAVELDPTITMGLAGYLQAVANYRLNRMDAARDSLLQVEKGPHQNLAVMHAMLADIYLRKQDTAGAAPEIRAYLKEAPQGSFAAQLRTNLDAIDKAAKAAGASDAKPVIAP